MTFLPQPGIGLTVATFAVVIGVLVFVHEMGHYLVARWLGIKADAFSIGFGAELVGWTDARGTRWKVGALPLGGYVQFAGDLDASSRPAEVVDASTEERAVMFQFRPLWQRALVILAGPMTNFLFAILIFTGSLRQLRQAGDAAGRRRGHRRQPGRRRRSPHRRPLRRARRGARRFVRAGRGAGDRQPGHAGDRDDRPRRCRTAS